MDGGRPDEAASAAPAPDEVAVPHSNERYTSMFTHHPHATFSVDPRGYYTDANARALEMTGLTLEQMRQTHFSQVIHPEDLPLMQAGFDRAMTGVPEVIEARVQRVDGEVLDIRCTAIPVVVGEEVIGIHGITEDITEANRTLRRLEEANAAKTLFLATVSHEVRTPLAVLVGATELLMDAELEPEPQHYADMLHRSSQRLIRLVDDVLEFSGLEAHQTVLRPRPFDVQALVQDVEEWAVPQAEDRDLAISFTVEESVPDRAVGDCRRITQVLTNLVQNALKFTDAGSVDVRVGSTTGAPDATWVEFTVTDTGIGISEEHQRTLFEPFAQASPHLAGDRQGIGLGLTICRELVSLMGGRMGVSSTLGEGSSFTAAVPLAPVTAGAAPVSAG